jgi:hypothetical protein
MRLSLSGEHTGDDYNLDVVTGADNSGGNIPGGRVLNNFAEAVMARDERRTEAERNKIIELLGGAAMVDASAIIAAFNLVARVADATGLPLEDYKEEASVELRSRLGLNSLVTE